MCDMNHDVQHVGCESRHQLLSPPQSKHVCMCAHSGGGAVRKQIWTHCAV
jgi:hypothetical protein